MLFKGISKKNKDQPKDEQWAKNASGKAKSPVPQSEQKLKFTMIGDGVTKNLSIYEYGDDVIAVDFGIGFPEDDMPGVDFIIPDMTYILENSHRFKGLFISHAHADHFAAVPYLLKELNVPIYANKLTIEYIKEMLDEKNFKDLKDTVSFHVFDETTEPVTLGAFTLSAFHVNHSVPGTLGIAIETPEGTMLHMADFKVDYSPVIDAPIDMKTIEEYSKKGVLCLASDCLGSKSEGMIESEKTLDPIFPEVFKELEGRQIFITTISSNISRMHQIITAAKAIGRKVAPAGRSIDQSIKIARGLGYLPFDDDDFVDVRTAVDMDQSTVVYIIAGCFGQHGSSLDRLSRGEHRDLFVQEGAYVVFSSEPNPPGVDVDVERMTSNLILAGAEVMDHNNKHLHVSGHGHKGDLTLIAEKVKPKYYIPLGGGVSHMRAYTHMIEEMGGKRDQVFELLEGESVVFSNGNAKRGNTIEINDIYMDGVGLSPVVIKDREKLSDDGVFVVVIPASQETRDVVGKVDVITRGFIYVKESKALIGMSRDVINKTLDKFGNSVQDWGAVKPKIEKDVQKFLFKETRRKPLVIVHSIFV